MSTPINRMSELVGVLRQQLTSKTNESSASVTGSESSTPNLAQPTRVESMAELRKRMGRDLRRFNLASDTDRKEARKLFVESVLSWDFGDRVMTDSRFSFMVREIEDTIGADKKTEADLDQLIRSLCTNAAA